MLVLQEASRCVPHLHRLSTLLTFSGTLPPMNPENSGELRHRGSASVGIGDSALEASSTFWRHSGEVLYTPLHIIPGPLSCLLVF